MQYDWSPDSTQLVVAGSINVGPFSLFIVDLDDMESRTITDTPLWGLTPSWSPDGTQIAYMLVADITGEQHGVYVTNVDGSGTTRLTYDEPAASALVWSPDGLKIAFTPATGRGVDVLSLHEGGADRVSVTDDAAGEGSSQPAWSPDSQSITFTSYIYGGNQEIYSVYTNGTGLRKITNHQAWDREPAWSPAGE